MTSAAVIVDLSENENTNVLVPDREQSAVEVPAGKNKKRKRRNKNKGKNGKSASEDGVEAAEHTQKWNQMVLHTLEELSTDIALMAPTTSKRIREILADHDASYVTNLLKDKDSELVRLIPVRSLVGHPTLSKYVDILCMIQPAFKEISTSAAPQLSTTAGDSRNDVMQRLNGLFNANGQTENLMKLANTIIQDVKMDDISRPEDIMAKLPRAMQLMEEQTSSGDVDMNLLFSESNLLMSNLSQDQNLMETLTSNPLLAQFTQGMNLGNLGASVGSSSSSLPQNFAGLESLLGPLLASMNES